MANYFRLSAAAARNEADTCLRCWCDGDGATATMPAYYLMFSPVGGLDSTVRVRSDRCCEQ